MQNIAINLQNNAWNHIAHREKDCLAATINEVKKCNYVRITKLHSLKLLYKPITFSYIPKISNLGIIINAHSLNLKTAYFTIYDKKAI